MDPPLAPVARISSALPGVSGSFAVSKHTRCSETPRWRASAARRTAKLGFVITIHPLPRPEAPAVQRAPPLAGQRRQAHRKTRLGDDDTPGLPARRLQDGIEDDVGLAQRDELRGGEPPPLPTRQEPCGSDEVAALPSVGVLGRRGGEPPDGRTPQPGER